MKKKVTLTGKIMISGHQKTFDAEMIFCSRPESYTCRQTQIYSKEWPWKALCLVMRAGQPQSFNPSPEKAEIHLKWFCISFSQRNTIHQLCLIENKKEKQPNKQEEWDKENSNSYLNHTYNVISSTMWVCVYVFLLTTTPDCWGHQIFLLLETQSYFDSKNCKNDRDRTRQREREVHINGGQMFKLVLLRFCHYKGHL